jgi:CheY-like chemotaxis protein
LEHHNIKILIVDDSKIAIKTISKLFEKTHPDITVYSATNMHDAGELLLQHQFDTIFLDLNIETPLDGELILEVLDEANSKVPVMIISSDQKSTEKMLQKFPKLNLVPFGKTFNTTNIQLSVYKITKLLELSHSKKPKPLN